MNWRILAASAILLMTFGAKAWLSGNAAVPPRIMLREFPKQMGDWTSIHEETLSDPIMGVLKADDYLLRTYRNAAGNQIDVFVAYYEAQKAGESMHSPKNCLPGAGWRPIQNDEVAMPVGAGGTDSTLVNRYVIEKNGERALVLYWYQAHGRIIASEYAGKMYSVLDALRTRRRDGAIVRLVVPISRSGDLDGATIAANDLGKTAAAYLPKYLPN